MCGCPCRLGTRRALPARDGLFWYGYALCQTCNVLQIDHAPLAGDQVHRSLQADLEAAAEFSGPSGEHPVIDMACWLSCYSLSRQTAPPGQSLIMKCPAAATFASCVFINNMVIMLAFAEAGNLDAALLADPEAAGADTDHDGAADEEIEPDPSMLQEDW